MELNFINKNHSIEFLGVKILLRITKLDLFNNPEKETHT